LLIANLKLLIEEIAGDEGYAAVGSSAGKLLIADLRLLIWIADGVDTQRSGRLLGY